ncbi:nitrate/nitrite transporter/facilitator [Teredinibacter turnerae T7901]|uniref:Nitrate/nitrite transporter n=1 Tax=Teredinibacter turnerae (strain ATCC 39867 / T7901) TaxID=377629 RepID=C5BNC9_TERTT|nr:NarK family nitrate/nitrite MFS transporter [Teredinibacter turnerae]ACR12033.1 nitrate/nitrite transporter/facilitator [Teredinibacter turnerae T7901]
MSHKLNLVDFSQANIRTLHLTWFAFFLTFVMWFSHAPMKPLIMAAFDLSVPQWKALLILNVALTIPARIVIGILVDKFGPRTVYSTLLVISGVLCVGFAFAQSYEQLAIMRFAMGFAGAGFVIGIRMVGEWFPARQVGLAEGVYGGWGNFGSAAAAFTLPSLALIYGGDDGWRYAIATTGLIAMVYGVFFYLRARNTPKGSTYFKPKKSGGLEVTSRKDFYFYLAMNIPMYLILAVLAWKLSPAGVGLLSQTTTYLLYGVLVVLGAIQFSQILKVNKEMLADGAPEHDKYSFKQVAILDWAYFVTFGSELAVVSMLPAFFLETFTSLSLVQAGALGAAFAFMNLVARPGGGFISDKFGRRKSLSIFIAGLAAGYFMLSQISGSWPIALAVAAVMVCSFFVQAGEGAVFAMVPLVKRRMTGQIAGMVGAYGNVGGVTFLTIYSFVDASTFFMVIAACAALVFLIIQMLEEPEGHMTETLADGTVQRIELT